MLNALCILQRAHDEDDDSMLDYKASIEYQLEFTTGNHYIEELLEHV